MKSVHWTAFFCSVRCPGDIILKSYDLANANACPSEDSGNLSGYYEKLQIIKDPAHPEHEDIKEWMEPGFDPSAFNLVVAYLDLRDISHR